MKVAYYIGKEELREDPSILGLLGEMARRGFGTVDAASEPVVDADLMLSFGGDGTFLWAAKIAHAAGIPVLGVNLGRMGFLAEASIEDVLPLLEEGNFAVSEREMLCARCLGKEFLAHNEVCVNRIGSGSIGIDVSIDGKSLPTYWGDGILVSTGAGSTAYNLSVGGPICVPSADVLVVSPIAPHNLGVRPLVIPSGSKVDLRVKSRGVDVSLSADGESVTLPDGAVANLELSPRTLKCVRLDKSNFIEALCSRLFWGQDVRNTN